MFYNHFITSDRVNRYPEYMDKEMRLCLKEKMRQEALSLYCSCSFYSANRLEYGISVDGKIYPLHQGYVHSKDCARNIESNKRPAAFCLKEDGTAEVFFGFDPNKFTIPDPKKAEEKSSEKKIKPAPLPGQEVEKEEKEPTDTLPRFLLELNSDTQKERATAGKGLLSADYFLYALQARLKKVYISGFDKPIKDLSLSEDGLQFFYQPLDSIDTTEGSKIVLKGYKKDYSYFLYHSTLEKEKGLFEAKYGISVDDALAGGHNVMAAGFIYMRLSKRQKLFKVVGRLHLFIVNENGLYCRSLEEAEELNLVSKYLRGNKRYERIQFDRIIDDPKVFGIFSQKGKKQVIVCKKKVPPRIAANGPDHIAFGTEKFSNEDLVTIEQHFMEE